MPAGMRWPWAEKVTPSWPGRKNPRMCAFLFLEQRRHCRQMALKHHFDTLDSDGTVFFTFVAFFPSVPWYCWLGLLTCKTVSQITYTVSVEMLNPAQSINLWNRVFLSWRLSVRPHRTRISDSDKTEKSDLMILECFIVYLQPGCSNVLFCVRIHY